MAILTTRNKSASAVVIAAIVGGFATSAAVGDTCPTTLAYLADRLPQYNNANLEQMRTAVLQQNIVEAMQRAREQGATPAQAAAAALDLAEKARAQMPVAEQCVRQLSPDPEGAMSALRNGTFRFSGAGTAMEACASQYVLSYYMVVSAKETAIVAACIANQR